MLWSYSMGCFSEARTQSPLGFRIFIKVAFDEVLRRERERDRHLFGSEAQVIDRYRRRYIPGQRIYLETVRPERLAGVVVDNNDPEKPRFHARR